MTYLEGRVGMVRHMLSRMRWCPARLRDQGRLHGGHNTAEEEPR